MAWVLKFFSLTCMLYQVTATFQTNFVIKRFESCNKDNETKFYGKVTTQNGNQYLDLDITLPAPMDENIGFTTDMQYSVDGKRFMPLFIVRDKYLCKAMNTYVGEFWYDLERAAQIIPGVCPIPKRRYYVHHHLLDYRKISLQTFPFGTLRLTVNVHDNNSKKKIFCMFMEIENVIN